MGSKSWLAPHVDRLSGGRRCASLSLLRLWKAGVLPCNPASGPEGVRRRRLRARRKPAPLLLEARFLRSLLRLAGRKIDRRFYFSRLLPGTQRGRAGRRAACSYILLRNSFLGKWGFFTQQRPLGLCGVCSGHRAM